MPQTVLQKRLMGASQKLLLGPVPKLELFQAFLSLPMWLTADVAGCRVQALLGAVFGKPNCTPWYESHLTLCGPDGRGRLSLRDLL